MAGYKKHIFICENLRDAESGRVSCGQHHSALLRSQLKEKLRSEGLHKTHRVSSSGCLGQCQHGPVMVIYPQAVWYGGVTEDDLEEIVRKSVLGEQIITRLIIDEDCKK